MAAKCVVVSAVNFSEGGPLTVLIDCLESAAQALRPEWEIVALVHDCKLIQNQHVRCLEFPESKRSWLVRLLLEWFRFKALSRELKPDLWFSLHDITPRVDVRRQVVYCHNPSPFYRLSLREASLEPKLLLFNWFYAYLYRVNIGRNHAVVVQQEWLRAEFQRRYAHPNVVVAHPAIHALGHHQQVQSVPSGKTVLLYPALPRVFKNFEVLCEAAARLPEIVQSQIEIRLTLDGTENRYARSVVRRYGNQPVLRFIGRQSRAEMARHYAECAAVLFPSRLETWGLPITEAKALGKSLLVADLPYAHETVGSYDRVVFLPAADSDAWAKAIGVVASGNSLLAGAVQADPARPFAKDWPQLWRLLTEGL
jgi:glycosyltransferase involved in cell wall biosynthesis